MLKKIQTLFAVKPEEFIKAVALGNVKKVKQYLSENQNNPKAINIKIDGKTVLMQAVLRDDVLLVQALLSFPGIEINAQDEDGNTALNLAAYLGNVEIAGLLTNKGCPIHHKNNAQLSAARIARQHKHEEYAALFEKEELIKAVNDGNLPGVHYLVKYVEPNFTDAWGNSPLLLAVRKGHQAIVEALGQISTIHLEMEDIHGDTAFLWAVHNGQIDIVHLLIQKGANWQHKNKNNQTSLEIARKQGHSYLVDLFEKMEFLQAVKDGHLEVVQKYLASPNPALIKIVKQHSQEAFLEAVRQGRLEMVKTLAAVPGLNLNGFDSQGNSALASAILNECLEVIDYLAKIPEVKTYGVNSNYDDAILLAARTGKADILKTIVTMEEERKALVKYQAQFLSAVEDGDLSQVKALYEDKTKKININYNYSSLGYNSYSALYIAAQNGHKEVVDYLLAIENIDMAKATKDGSTPLHIAALKGHTEIVRSLIETAKKRGKSIVDSQRTSDQTTALFIAAQEGNLEIVQLLVAAKADPNLRSKWGTTALCKAISGNYPKVVDCLLTIAGIDIQAGSYKDGTAPLHFAAFNGLTETVKALLQLAKKRDQSIVNSKRLLDESTALHIAAQQGHLEIAKLLLDAGADANITNSDGNSPLDIAVWNDRIDISSLLDGSSQKFHNSLIQRMRALDFELNLEGICFGFTELVKQMVLSKPEDLHRFYDTFFKLKKLRVTELVAMKAFHENLYQEAEKRALKELHAEGKTLSSKELISLRKSTDEKLICIRKKLTAEEQEQENTYLNILSFFTTISLSCKQFKHQHLIDTSQWILSNHRHFNQAKPKAGEYIARVNKKDGLSIKYLAYDGSMKTYHYRKKEIQAVLGDDYSAFITALANKNNTKIISCLKMLFNHIANKDAFFLEKRMYTQLDNTHWVAPLIQSEYIEKKGGISQLAFFTGCYTKAELPEFLKTLSTRIKKHSGDVYLMSAPQTNDYKISNKRDLYLYRAKDGGFFYHYSIQHQTFRFDLPDLQLLTELSNGLEFNQSEQNPCNLPNNAFRQAVLNITLERGHTRLIPIVCCLESSDHSIAFKHGREDDSHEFFDVNKMPLSFEELEFTDAQHTAKKIKKGLFSKKATLFQIRVYTTKDEEFFAQPVIDSWRQDLIPWQQCTKEKAVFLDKNGISWLWMACRIGDISTVQALLKAGADIHTKNKNGVSALMVAALEGHVDIVSLLLKHADIAINEKDETQTSALYYAAKYGRTEIVKLLLKHKAIEVNSKAKDGSTPLHIAIQKGHTDIVKLLLETKPIDVQSPCQFILDAKTVDAQPLIKNTSLLHFAIQWERLPIVHMLLDKIAKGIDPNLPDDSRKTVLYAAVERGNLEFVRLLLAAKFKKALDVNAKCLDGSPLYYAAQQGNVELLKLLIKANADVNTLYKEQYTPAWHAAELGLTTVVRVLIKAKADLKISNKDGVTPLMMALFKGHTAVVKILLQSNSDLAINAQERTCGWTALHFAVNSNNIEAIELLLRAKSPKNPIDVHAVALDGNTPLLLAIRQEKMDIVKLLLASRQVDHDVVKLFIRHRAKTFHKDPLQQNLSLAFEASYVFDTKNTEKFVKQVNGFTEMDAKIQQLLKKAQSLTDSTASDALFSLYDDYLNNRDISRINIILLSIEYHLNTVNNKKTQISGTSRGNNGSMVCFVGDESTRLTKEIATRGNQRFFRDITLSKAQAYKTTIAPTKKSSKMEIFMDLKISSIQAAR